MRLIAHRLHIPLVLLAAMVAQAPNAQAAKPAELLAEYTAAAKAPASPERGKALFTKDFNTDMGWTCSSCHTTDPTKPGKHASSDKPIAPLAPATNAERFTSRTKVEFHFRLNCKDVVGRECTAGEKADVMAWLISLKP